MVWYGMVWYGIVYHSIVYSINITARRRPGRSSGRPAEWGERTVRKLELLRTG